MKRNAEEDSYLTVFDESDESWKNTESDQFRNTEVYENDVSTSSTQKFMYNKDSVDNDGTEPPDEEVYDYQKFKSEYDEQMFHDMKKNRTSNYTEKSTQEEITVEPLYKLFNFSSHNCTVDFGVKKIKCLISEFRERKDKIIATKSISKIWIAIKVWLLIYIFFSVICWCQKGWCCCCFRCKFCFPRKRILLAKKYYVNNPPGVLAQQHKKRKLEKLTYKPTEFEQYTYRDFEDAIRSI